MVKIKNFKYGKILSVIIILCCLIAAFTPNCRYFVADISAYLHNYDLAYKVVATMDGNKAEAKQIYYKLIMDIRYIKEFDIQQKTKDDHNSAITAYNELIQFSTKMQVNGLIDYLSDNEKETLSGCWRLINNRPNFDLFESYLMSAYKIYDIEDYDYIDNINCNTIDYNYCMGRLIKLDAANAIYCQALGVDFPEYDDIKNTIEYVNSVISDCHSESVSDSKKYYTSDILQTYPAPYENVNEIKTVTNEFKILFAQNIL